MGWSGEVANNPYSFTLERFSTHYFVHAHRPHYLLRYHYNLPK